jgi:glutathione S-transferase
MIGWKPIWADGPWAIGDQFTMADCAAAPSLFYADWLEEIGPSRPRLAAYRARLLAHPIVARPSMKEGHIGHSSRWERPTATEL